jgi:hypothetical protein
VLRVAEYCIRFGHSFLINYRILCCHRDSVRAGLIVGQRRRPAEPAADNAVEVHPEPVDSASIHMTHKRCSLHRQNRPHPCRYRTSTTSFWFAADFLICLGVIPIPTCTPRKMLNFVWNALIYPSSNLFHRIHLGPSLCNIDAKPMRLLSIYNTVHVCVYGALLMLPWSNFVCSTTGFISISLYKI